jgi:hypothetical protein
MSLCWRRLAGFFCWIKRSCAGKKQLKTTNNFKSLLTKMVFCGIMRLKMILRERGDSNVERYTLPVALKSRKE